MTLEQLRCIHQALENHQKPPRTHGARIHDAIKHIRDSKKRNPSGRLGLHVTLDGVNDNEKGRCHDEV